MLWYTKMNKQASAPPAYIIERISDLSHAIELITSSPGKAKEVLLHVSERLAGQKDDEFSKPILEAVSCIIDNPSRAKEIINRVIGMMIVAKDIYEESEKRKTWKSLIQ